MNEKGPNSANELPSGLAAALRTDARKRSERDEIFWSSQRARIRGRIRAQASQRHPLRIAFAGAAFLFLAILLTAPAGTPPQAVPPAAAAVDADQQLLIAVERALASSTPQSLAPVSPFVQPDSNSHATQTIPHKEHRNED
jgi:hypothetical protein